MKTYILTFLILISSFSFAQNYKVKWGAKGKLGSNNLRTIDYAGEARGNNYLVASTINNIGVYKSYIEKVNRSLAVESSKNLKKGGNFGGYPIVVKDKLYFLKFSANLIGKKAIELYWNVYSLNGDFIKAIPLEKFEDIEFKILDTSFEIFLKSSPDGSKVGFSMLSFNKRKGILEIYSGSMDTESLHKVETIIKPIDIGEKFHKAYLEDFIITNEGTLINLISLQEEKKAEWDYEIHRSAKNGESTNKFSLNVKDGLLDEVKLSQNQKEDVFFAGSYLQPKNKNKLERVGFILGALNIEDMKIENYSSYFFDEDKKELYSSRDMVFDFKFKYNPNNDNAALIAEKRLTQVNHSTSNSGGTSTTVRHYYLDAIVLTIDKEVNIKGVNIIEKSKLNGFDKNYFAFYKNNKFYFLYDDLEVNQLRKEKGKSISTLNHYKPKKSVTNIVEIDESNNKANNKELFKFKKVKGSLCPDRCMVLDDKIIINATFKKKTQYGELIL